MKSTTEIAKESTMDLAARLLCQLDAGVCVTNKIELRQLCEAVVEAEPIMIDLDANSTKVRREETITEEELLAIEARANAATLGPWDDYFETGLKPFVCTYLEHKCGVRELKECVLSSGSTEENYQNIVFAAHARTDIPALIAEVRRLEKENDVLLRSKFQGIFNQASTQALKNFQFENAALKAEIERLKK